MSTSSGLLPIIRAQLANPRTGKSMDTCALQYTGSRVTLINKPLKELSKLDTKDCTRELAGANSSISITLGVTVRVFTTILKLENWWVHRN